jgi:putative oxidoreductase
VVVALEKSHPGLDPAGADSVFATVLRRRRSYLRVNRGPKRGLSETLRVSLAAAIATRGAGPRARLAAAIRLAAAAVFVAFGIGKFVDHASELASFQQYALPAPEVFVYAIGVLEIVGGVLLAIGLLVRPAALALAGDMVGAIVVSGVGRGENVSLTLAPLSLIAMIFLIRAGAGSWSVDGRLVGGQALAAEDCAAPAANRIARRPRP